MASLTNHRLSIEAKYDVTRLIAYLKKHLENHIVDYEKAMEVYNVDLRNKLNGIIMDANIALNSDMVRDRNHPVYRSYNAWLNTKKPVDAKKLYEQYITLLENVAESTVTLDVDDANAIINDEWDWAIEAKVTNSFYSNRK